MTRKRLRPADVAKEFGRSPGWLKQLERKGIIPPAARDPFNGYRTYEPEDIERIRDAVLAARS